MKDLSLSQKKAILKRWEFDKLWEVKDCALRGIPKVSFNHQQNHIEIDAEMILGYNEGGKWDWSAKRLNVYTITPKEGMDTHNGIKGISCDVIDRYPVSILERIRNGELK